MKKAILIFGLIALLGVSCDTNKPDTSQQLPDNAIEKVLESYPNGKPKAIEYSVQENDRRRVVAFKEFYESGKVRITGRYNQIKEREGLWESFHENGNKWSIGSYIDGIQEGEKIVWYENGKEMYRGSMKADKPVGTWAFYDTQGNKTTKNYN